MVKFGRAPGGCSLDVLGILVMTRFESDDSTAVEGTPLEIKQSEKHVINE